MYDSPTGKIVGGSYLGKSHISKGVFPEGDANIDPKVSATYYVADRKYNIKIINDYLKKDYTVLLDRYVESNMAHQGGKIQNTDERKAMYKWLEKLEYDLFELLKPDMTIFLYMPYEHALKLRMKKNEASDQLEGDKKHLLDAQKSYLELAKIYKFKTINCIKNRKIRSKEDIHENIYNILSI